MGQPEDTRVLGHSGYCRLPRGALREREHGLVMGMLMENDTIQVMKHSAGEPRFLLQWQVLQRVRENSKERGREREILTSSKISHYTDFA